MKRAILLVYLIGAFVMWPVQYEFARSNMQTDSPWRCTEADGEKVETFDQCIRVGVFSAGLYASASAAAWPLTLAYRLAWRW